MVRGGRRASRSTVVRFACCKSRSSVGLLRRDVAGGSAGRLFGHVSLVREILEHGSDRMARQKNQQNGKDREAVRLLQLILALGLKKDPVLFLPRFSAVFPGSGCSIVHYNVYRCVGGCMRVCVLEGGGLLCFSSSRFLQDSLILRPISSSCHSATHIH